jgi:hypothetical protein
MSPRKTAAERAAEAEAAAAEETQTADESAPAEETQSADDAAPEVPLEDLAARADAEGLQLEDATGDDSDPLDPQPDPDADGNDGDQDPDVVEPDPEQTGDAEGLQFDPNRLGAPEPYVHKRWPHAARGRIVAHLFDAADVLGYQPDVIRSTSDGFKYPENIDRYLFPSEYDA